MVIILSVRIEIKIGKAETITADTDHYVMGWYSSCARYLYNIYMMLMISITQIAIHLIRGQHKPDFLLIKA